MTSTFNVLQLHNFHRERKGGAPEVIRREAAMLGNAGHDVTLFSVDSEDHVNTSQLKQASAIIWNREVQRRLGELVDRNRPDVAHLHTPFPFMSPSVVETLHRRSIPVVMTSHSFRIPCVGTTLERNGEPCELCVGTSLRLPAVKYGCYQNSKAKSVVAAAASALAKQRHVFDGQVSLHLALTPWGKDILIRDGIPASNVSVHPNFVPEPDVEPRNDRNGFLYVGRLVPEKGVGTLVNAWNLLGGDAPALHIVGNGPMREHLENQSTSGNVTFHGSVENREALQMMAETEALIFPSLWREGIGVSWIEALAMGTPVIYSNPGNFSELLDSHNAGMAFDVGNPEALAAAVEKFGAASVTERSAMADNGRSAYRSEYSESAALSRLVSAYERVAGSPTL